jgi:penicillin-binding protein 2
VRIYEDLRGVQDRVGHLQYGVVCLLGLLLVYFWYLQVLRGRYYRTLAENNRSRVVAIAAPRGRLLDRHGRSLVENRPSFNVVLNPEHVPDLDGTVARLAGMLRMGEAQIRERLARRGGGFRPVVVKADATLADVAAVEARRLEMPEASVDVVPLRSYPLAAAAAHALGRIGEVSDRQLQSPEFTGIDPGYLVGQAGVEFQYNRRLMGKDGFRRVIVNSRGVEVAEMEKVAPRDGPTLTLTIDAELQKAMDAAFEGRAGSAVALDPATGEVLAMTSTPAYDPNEFATGIEPAEWGRLSGDPGTPLMNRVIQGQYSPGSVFKIVIATAALEEGVITPSTSFYCPGYLAIYNTVFRCHKPAGHGMVNLHQALAKSCNVFFYHTGVRLDVDRIARYARRMGLGAATGIDLPHEASGLVPNSQWKLLTQRVPWYPGETVSVAIGQGQVTVTPMQLARLAAVVGSGGHLARPHLVKAVGGVEAPAPAAAATRLRPETLAVVKRGLCAVVNEAGTGARARIEGIEVCGKTGSAQVVGHARLARAPTTLAMQPHGWFVALAPAERPRIALAVLVEHGRSGAESAAPVARKILAEFFGTDPPEPSDVAAEADREHTVVIR